MVYRYKEIYYKKLAHVIWRLVVQNLQGWPVGWRLKRAEGADKSVCSLLEKVTYSGRLIF